MYTYTLQWDPNGARLDYQVECHNLTGFGPTMEGETARQAVALACTFFGTHRDSETIFDNLAAGPAREAGPVKTSLSGLLKRQRKRERFAARASGACRCPGVPFGSRGAPGLRARYNGAKRCFIILWHCHAH